MFLQITQGDSNADVELYEQQDNNKFKVTKWTTTKDTSALVSKIDQEIIANAGVDCIRARVRNRA